MSADFDDLVHTYYQSWFRYHPEEAVEVGFPGYECLLTPYSDEDLGAIVCLNDKLRAELDELDRRELTTDQDIDYQVLYGALMLENQRLLDLEPKQPDPERILPINAIYQLLVRDLDNFDEALISRLAATPSHLQVSKSMLESRGPSIPPLWLQSTITSARAGADFINGLLQHPKVTEWKAPITGLAVAVRKAVAALKDFADFLENKIGTKAKGDFACGRSYFQNLLCYRHFLNIDPDQLHDFGQSLFEQTRQDLQEACKELSGSTDIDAMTRKIQAEHPAMDEVLAHYRTQMQAAKDYVTANDLVTLPPEEQLDVIDTPVFLRHQIPFAAYHEPAPGDDKQQGYYYVTPATNESQLAEHNRVGLMNTCVHEAWPGHHLQFVTANLKPASRTLPRLLNPSATLYEGWALYCEQLMHEQGFLNRPEHHFVLLKDRLWRALRIIIDVELHTRGLTIEAAAERMVNYLGFPRSQAIADLTWYTQAPTVPMGYATGWALINAVRKRYWTTAGNAELKPFHDRLLSIGSIGLPLVISQAFGMDLWQQVKRDVFTEVKQ